VSISDNATHVNSAKGHLAANIRGNGQTALIVVANEFVNIRSCAKDCKECGGTQVCRHGKPKHHCVDCGGSSICEHGRVQMTCIDCKGSQICKHGRRRSGCRDCGGAAHLCKGEACSIFNVKERNVAQVKGLCCTCYKAANPNASQLKMRTEILFMAEIERRLPWLQEEASVYVWDCKLPCTLKKPDAVWVYAESNCSMHFELDETGSAHEDNESRVVQIHAALGTLHHRLVRVNSDTTSGRPCVKRRRLSNGNLGFEAIEPEFSLRVSTMCDTLKAAWEHTKAGTAPVSGDQKQMLFFDR
jgi:hypothetical protein